MGDARNADPGHPRAPGQAGALREGDRPSGLAWLPVPSALAIMAALWASGSRTVHDAPRLLTILNFVFTTLVSLHISYLIGRSFRVRGTPGLLLLGCGTLIWGVNGSLGIVLGGANRNAGIDTVNVIVTAYNCGVWLSAFCHLTGTVHSLRPRMTVRATGPWLATGYLLSLAVLGTVTLAALWGWMPPFFIQGRGGTPLRQFVLGSSIVMFVLAALLLAIPKRRERSPFLYWYSLALSLVAAGLFGVMIQSTYNSLLNWAGRAAQHLGGIYMLIAAFASARETRAWGITLEASLRQARQRFEELFDMAADGVLVCELPGPHGAGSFLQANPAIRRLLGYTEEDFRSLPPEEILSPEDLAAPRREPASPAGAEGCVLRREGTIPARDGRRIPVEIRSRFFRHQDRPMLLSIVRDITDRKEAEEALHRGLRRFELVVETVSELLRSPEPQRIVEPLCRKVMEHLDCHVFINYLADGKTGRLRLNGCAGISPEDARRIEWLEYGTAVCGCVGRDGRSIVAERIQCTPDERTGLVRSFGIRAYACHPLLGSDGRVIGTLSFGTRSRDAFSEEELSLMRAVTDHVAVAMTRLRNEEALKASIADKDTLLRELAHRTKNNMQVIGSLLSLQAASSGDGKLAGALADAQDRIRAMALVHEKLYRSGSVSSISMREYLADLLDSLLCAHRGAGGGVEAILDLEELSLSLDTALPCGLIVNELVSNSLKHAFPGRKDGTISVSLRRAGEGIVLSYRDDGPGLPPGLDLSRLPSLGLKLVRNLATRQLRGTMEVGSGPAPEFLFTFRDPEWNEGRLAARA